MGRHPVISSSVWAATPAGYCSPHAPAAPDVGQSDADRSVGDMGAQPFIDAIEPLGKMGVEVVAETPTSIRVRLPLQGNANHFGTMYAGSLFSLAEFPFGALCRRRLDPERFVPVVGEMSIRYRKPVATDAYVVVEVPESDWADMIATAEERGKARYVVALEITDESGEVMATTEATYFLLAMSGV